MPACRLTIITVGRDPRITSAGFISHLTMASVALPLNIPAKIPTRPTGWLDQCRLLCLQVKVLSPGQSAGHSDGVLGGLIEGQYKQKGWLQFEPPPCWFSFQDAVVCFLAGKLHEHPRRAPIMVMQCFLELQGGIAFFLKKPERPPLGWLKDRWPKLSAITEKGGGGEKTVTADLNHQKL